MRAPADDATEAEWEAWTAHRAEQLRYRNDTTIQGETRNGFATGARDRNPSPAERHRLHAVPDPLDPTESTEP